MERYKIKFKIGWSGKEWYAVQERILFGLFWWTLMEFDSLTEAETKLNLLKNILNNGHC